MSILKSVKSIVSFGTVSMLLIGTSLFGKNALASGPVFNQMQGDRDMVVGRTQNMSDYTDPVSATPSDRVTVAVYYHNNIEGTTAIDTRIKVDLPTDSSIQHVIKTTLSADNAQAVTNTVVNGQIVGAPDFTINLSQAAKVSYVPGSTLWFPDLAQNPNQTGLHMPDDIVTAQGLNIHNIDGCWSHAGYVLFDVVFDQKAQLETAKSIALYGGDNQWHKSITASQGDQVRYQILFGDKGNGTATNVAIVDTLPADLTYKPGSIIKRVKDAHNNDVDVTIPDSQVSFNGQTITIPLGNVMPGEGNSGYVYLIAEVNRNLSVGTHTAVNTAEVRADNAASVSDTATATITVTPSPVSDLKVLKEVVNVTQGGTRWVRENTASPGDRLQYRITVYNQGTAASNNVSVTDLLPQHVSYVVGSTKIYTTDPNSGTALPDGITSGGVTIGTIANGVPQGNRYITFDAKIDDTMAAGNQDLINTANVFENGVQKDSSTAKTTVTSETGLLVTKEIWNASNGQWVTHLDGVKPSDVLTFRILVRNTGNSTVTNPVVKDDLSGMNLATYVPGSSRLDGSVQIGDEWITSGAGYLIANVTPGNFKQISFQARVGACPPGGTFTQTNKAIVTADGITAKSATADFMVTAGAPAIPR